VDDSSISTLTSKKPHPLSTHITGNMLLGEQIIVSIFPFFSGFFLYLSSLICSNGTLVELHEDEDENNSTALITRR
jgi:hypothetical protein